MPIDYSKWDKIELSDDSDVEVHPNVDKSSFIKWKQRDIHEKRHQRNIEIKLILVQLTMYAKLNERVDYLLEHLLDLQLLDDSVISQQINAKFEALEKFDFDRLKCEKGDELRKGLRDLQFDPQEVANTPCYNEMIEDLFTQIKEDHEDARANGAKVRQYLKEHRQKIDDVLSKLAIKLDDLLYQKSLLITNEDLHTGFDKTFLNKSEEEETETRTAATTAPAAPAAPAPATQVASGSSTAAPSAAGPSPAAAAAPTAQTTPATTSIATTPALAEDDLTILPDTVAFSKIPATDIQSSAEFLFKHTKICTEQQKDALLMSAFDAQLSGDAATTLQIIHQSLLLQYIAQLAGPRAGRDQIIKAIKLFCSKVADKDAPASAGFKQDVANTFAHIQKRCEVIKAEHAANTEGEGEALIQLKALDDDTQLLVTLPQPNTKEHEIFTTQIPKEMQAAVKTGSLDEVNKVFAEMKIEEAEHILELFDECGVIGINAYLEDENEFKQLQEQYHDNLATSEDQTEGAQQDYNTVDEVD
jgi:cell division cycle protein 37